MVKESDPFGPKYAKYYDILYEDKNYAKECDFIEEAFRKYSSAKSLQILDIGCGTGGHLLQLACRGYKVVGIDKSRYMVEIARKKIQEQRLKAEIYIGEVTNFSLDMKFDACIMMFAVINYIVETEELIKALKNIREHLVHGAVFVFDTWYGPAVLNIRPSTRIKVIEKGGSISKKFFNMFLVILKYGFG